MHRLTRLDGLRGFAAVYVMLCHALPYTDVPARLAGIFYHGEAAVDLFFALSGLVVIHSLERFDYRFWPFLNGRAGRLLPVYFPVLALATLLLQSGAPLAAMPWIKAGSAPALFWSKGVPGGMFRWHVLAHVFLLQGVLPQGVLPWVWITVLGPAWSLSTEWQFYVVMALVVARLPSAHRLVIFTFLMLGLGAVWQVAAPALPGFWTFNRAFLPEAAPWFALGLASAAWMRGRIAPYFACLSGVLVLELCSGVPSRALIAIGWSLVLLAQRHPSLPVLPRLLDSQAAQRLGAISYPLYLVNQPVQRGCAMLIAPLTHSVLPFTLLWLPVSLLACLAVAALLHYWVERPAMRRAKPVLALPAIR